MSVRSTKLPPQAVFPRTGPSAGGPSVSGPQAPPQKEPAKPGASKSAPQPGSASATSTAPEGGFDDLPDKRDSQGRAGLKHFQGEAAHPAPHGQGSPAREARPAAPELPQQRKTTDREPAPAERQAPGGRAKLRAIVMDRLLLGMNDVHSRLVTFAQNPGTLGVVNLSLVIAESSFTYALWKEPSTVPARKAGLVNALGIPQSTGDAAVLKELMGEVHQAFVDFQASKAGLEARRQYEEVLQRYETMQVLPIVPGHDTGPILAELQRLKIAHEKAFSRSLLLHPLLLAVGLTPDEGSATQVMIAGMTLEQLGKLVVYMRRLNPRLTNRQVCQLLLLATADKKNGGRKSLGASEMNDVQELARQLLRLQVTEQLFV